MREILRRTVLAVGLLTGLWMVVWPASQLFRVYPIDWEHERAGKESRQAFIAHETEDRVITVVGPEWEGFFNAVADTSLNQPPNRSWQARMAKSPYTGSLYFRTNEPPLSGIVGDVERSGSSSYVRVGADLREEYLFVALNGRDEVVRHAPADLAFPLRHVGAYVLLAAFLFYVALPWPQPPVEGLYYSRATAAALPDLTGAIVGGMFFVIPIIVPANFAGDSPFDPGWNVLTAAFWLLALVTLSMLAVAAWYMSRRLELTPEGFTYDALNVHTSRRWEDIERVDGHERPAIPPWLRKALFVVALVNWRALAPALIFGGKEAGLRIVCKDGTTQSFMLKTLIGGEAFIGRVRARGIPIAPAVYEALGKNPADPALPAHFPRVSRGFGRVALAVIIGAALLSFTYMTAPVEALDIKPGSLRAQPFALPTEEPVTVTWETLEKQNDIIAQVELERRKLDELAERMKTASPDQRATIRAEFDRTMTRITELQEEFEAVRRGLNAGPR